MLDVLEASFLATKGIQRFTAPTNHVFDIKGFVCLNRADSANEVFVNRRYVEEQAVIISSNDDLIFGMALTTGGHNLSVNLPEGIRTKHISVGPRVDDNINLVLLIYYELKTASKVELIWEFVKRGKNP